MIKLLRCMVLIFAMLVSSWLIIAEEAKELHQIEIIFFEHLGADRFEEEIWPEFVGRLDTRKAVKLGDVNEASVAVVDLPKMLLNDQTKILRRSPNQRLIEHKAWTQPLIQGTKSTQVYLESGKDNEVVDALIEIKPVRNLYALNLDMVYKIGDREFRVTRELKLKKKEIYYVDHPVISAMVMVSPLEK